MKVLSIRQPYVEQIMTGAKTREYRTWRTAHRGPLLIHASLTLADLLPADLADARKGVGPYTVGAIVGVVDVIGCEEVIDGDGVSYAFVLARPRRLVVPIPLKGRLRLFDYTLPEDTQWMPSPT